jgi:hypothetical protein
MRIGLAAAAALVWAAGPAAPADERLHLFLHFTDTAQTNLDVAARVGLALEADGFDVVDLRPVEAEMRATTVRFFEPELRRAAQRLGDELEEILAAEGVTGRPVRVQDFTFYRPKPPPRSLEVWFATQDRSVAGGSAAAEPLPRR